MSLARVITVIFMLAAQTAYAAKTLCEQGEAIIFSCRVKKSEKSYWYVALQLLLGRPAIYSAGLANLVKLNFCFQLIKETHKSFFRPPITSAIR